ncbi:MAG: response regulator [Gemmatimonadota bacterium]
MSPGADRRLLALVAEDEPLASMALRAQLEALQFRVLGPARNGHEAVHLGACHPVDVALFDVLMPGLSGLDAAIHLFDQAPTPVVLLTGVGAADLPDPIPEPPIFGVLTKPVDLAELGAALSTARDRFLQWARERHLDVHADHARRDTLARAIHRTAPTRRPAAAAAEFLDLARDQGRSPLALARSLLDEDPA